MYIKKSAVTWKTIIKIVRKGYGRARLYKSLEGLEPPQIFPSDF